MGQTLTTASGHFCAMPAKPKREHDNLTNPLLLSAHCGLPLHQQLGQQPQGVIQQYRLGVTDVLLDKLHKSCGQHYIIYTDKITLHTLPSSYELYTEEK